VQQGEPAPKRQRIEVTKMPFKYGKADFATLRQKGTFYVDNTRFIRTLHDNELDLAFLHRPPRFGKSLFLSTLEAYYDISVDEKTHQRLFGDLDIGKNPVPGARQYYVLRWDFSVDVSEPEMIARFLHNKIKWSIRNFAARYRFQISDKPTENALAIYYDDNDSLNTFTSLVASMSVSGLPFYTY